MKNFFINFLLLTITFIFLYITLTVPITVYRPEDLRTVKLGLPLPFIVQDQVIDPPLPWKTSLATPRENPTKILWLPFLADFIITFAVLKLIIKILKH